MKRTELGTLGEFGLIDHLTKGKNTQNPSTIKGIGDDAAVIKTGDKMTLISTDLLVEGIHFDMMYTPLKHLGYKAIVVNLSDIYAMNGTPKQVTVSLAISNRFSVEALEELYEGMYTACKVYGVDLVGGDTTSSLTGLVISVTAIGEAGEDQIVYRNTAKEGDLICASGDMGGAYLGLQILEREKQVYMANPDMQPQIEDKNHLVHRLLKPEARKDIIEQFAKAGFKPTAMIDVSDGLASDLMHICHQSNLGAFVEEANVPIHEQTYMTAIDFRIDPITCALSGGEDYELLFTVDPKNLDQVKYMNDVYIMGEMVAKEDGIQLHTKQGKRHDIIAQGWNHFKKEE